MTDRIKLVQGQDFQLAGGGIGLTDTSITIDDFVLPNSGVPITMDMFGEIGYITLEPETQREENISFTGVTQNGDSTATITGVVRGLPLASTDDQADYNTPDLSLRQAHSGGSLLRITNSVSLLQWFAGKLNDETIEGAWTFPGTTATGRPKNVVDADAILSNELVTRGEVTRLNQAILIPPTVDSVSTGTTGTSQANSLSWNHTTSNDFRLLEVSVICQEDVTISSITYNAVGLTFRSSETRVSGNLRVEKWTLTAPALGTNAILVTFSGNTYATGFGVSLNNVDQTSPIDATGTATNGSSTSASDSITTINNNSLILDVVGTAIDPQTFTVGSNQTLLEEKSDSATRTGAISTKLMETAGATTMSYTLGTTGDWAMVTVSYKGVTNAGGSTIVIEDEGVVVGVPADTLNFTGGGVTVIGAGTTKTVNIPSNQLEVQDEGSPVDTNVTLMNFVGQGVQITQTSSGEVEVDIGGAGGSPFTKGQEFQVRVSGGQFINQIAKFGTWSLAKVYAGSSSLGDEISVFSEDPTTKALTFSQTLTTSAFSGTRAPWGVSVSEDGSTLYILKALGGTGAWYWELKSYDSSFSVTNTYTSATFTNIFAGPGTAFFVSGSQVVIQGFLSNSAISGNRNWYDWTISGASLTSQTATNLEFYNGSNYGVDGGSIYARPYNGKVYLQKVVASGQYADIAGEVRQYSYSATNFTLEDTSTDPIQQSMIQVTGTSNALAVGGFEMVSATEIGRWRNTTGVVVDSGTGTGIYYQLKAIYNEYTF